ncbi:MAG TPA: class I SAM-dependent methyltransferase [Verrucomicrobiae bacterium]|nr:class I SAM-dependent methyltransferase [Verrucomicrobiae bacterium]
MVFAEEAGAQFANGTFYEQAGSEFYASEEKLAGDYSPVRYRREINFLRKHCSQGRVLDVGCSTGGFLYYLQKSFPHDYAICGNDVATCALEYAASQGVPVLRQAFALINTPEPFDAICFWAVLEHLAHPSQFLKKAHGLLSEGGHCFVLVPNIASLATRILGPKYRYILPQHLNYFSIRTLGRLAADCGFRVERATTMHFNPAVILQDLRSSNGMVADAERARLLVKTNRLKANPRLTPLRWCYAACEAVLGRTGLADNIAMVLIKK